jgi:hypothetical protein
MGEGCSNRDRSGSFVIGDQKQRLVNVVMVGLNLIALLFAQLKQ